MAAPASPELGDGAPHRPSVETEPDGQVVYTCTCGARIRDTQHYHRRHARVCLAPTRPTLTMCSLCFRRHVSRRAMRVHLEQDHPELLTKLAVRVAPPTIVPLAPLVQPSVPESPVSVADSGPLAMVLMLPAADQPEGDPGPQRHRTREVVFTYVCACGTTVRDVAYQVLQHERVCRTPNRPSRVKCTRPDCPRTQITRAAMRQHEQDHGPVGGTTPMV